MLSLATAAVVACALGVKTARGSDSAEMSRQARAAIERGLAYLAGNQNEDGSWPGSYGNTTGIVASCSLAFMGAGHCPGQGRYGANLARCVQFIMRNAQPDGLLYRRSMRGHTMYHHGLGALALAEAWGMTQDDRIRETLKRSVERIVASQNWKGGWRYEPRPKDDDLSVTVMQLMALRAAKDAGIFVPKDVIDMGIKYIKSCHNPTESSSLFIGLLAGIIGLCYISTDSRGKKIIKEITHKTKKYRFFNSETDALGR